MYSPQARNTHAKIESEVFYWQLFGFQVICIYGCLVMALCTGAIAIREPTFDAAVTTVTAIFLSNLLLMPQSPQRSFAHCKSKRKKLSNTAYRFSGQWKRRSQDKAAAQKMEFWTYVLVRDIEIWVGGSFRSLPNCRRCCHARRGPRFQFRSCSISPVIICGTPGDVALRGAYLLAGQAAVRWYVAFHYVQGVATFMAQIAVYCLFGAIPATFVFIATSFLAYIVCLFLSLSVSFWYCASAALNL